MGHGLHLLERGEGAGKQWCGGGTSQREGTRHLYSSTVIHVARYLRASLTVNRWWAASRGTWREGKR
jgi:hypothetical protein